MQTKIIDRPHPVLKVIAEFISYILHPIFVPLYVAAFLLYLHPSYFSGFSDKAKQQVLLIIVLNAVFFPLISTLLLKGVGFIDSVFLRTSKDRIIPYIICGIFFFWTYTVFRQQELYPPILSSFWLGVFLASSAALIANIYFKISMHTLGMGGWLGLFIVISQSNSMLMTWPLSIVILLCGFVASSRMIISNHTEKEIYSGFLIGLAAQAISAFVIL